jgi:cytoskeletal protein RodZ
MLIHNPFIKKQLIIQETLGEKLQKVRLGKGWSLDKASEQIKISKCYLQALENSQYDKIPGEIYVKNFLKVYSQKLGLTSKEILKQYQLEKDIVRGKNFHYSLKEISDAAFSEKIINPRVFKLTIVGLAIIVLTAYLWINIYQIIQPPFLKIYSPTDNITINKQVITIKGQSIKETQVIINNQEITLSPDGLFQSSITLRKGLNLIVIKAKRKHSLERKIIRHILVEEDKK